MRNAGYFRTPTIHRDTVVFVSEDDLWSVPLAGGVARRLTAGLGGAMRPALSPDGRWIAFTSQEEMHPEVWAMPADGGQARRVTFLGEMSVVAGWSLDGEILFRSDAQQPFLRIFELWSVAPDGGQPRKLPYGPANEISFGPGTAVVLGRNTADLARWKRYRGGTVGRLWVDAKGTGAFKPICDNLNGNLAHPMWIGKRIWFVSDHEGIGNLYSCTPDGRDVRRHTDHGEYYARFASTDGSTIVYQHGAELWALDLASGASRRIEVDFPSPRTQRNRKFAEATEYLHGADLHPDGHSLAFEVRGHLVTMPLWEGAVRHHGKETGIRYRLGQWLSDGKRIVALSDEGGEESLEVHSPNAAGPKRLRGLDLGRAHALVANPRKPLVAVANHRHELLFVDVDTGKRTLVDRSKHAQVSGLSWSPDGAWLAYSFAENNRTRSIKIARVATGKTHLVTPPRFGDYEPAWDPEGRYLYFLSYRTFDPIYDSFFFDLGFPRGARPYLVALQKDAPSPLVPQPKGFGEDQGDKKDEKASAKGKDAKGKKKKEEPVKIDLGGIEHRVQVIPVPEARYRQLRAIKGKVLFTSFQPEGALGTSWADMEEGPKGSLEVYDFAELKHDSLIQGVGWFDVARDGATLMYGSGRRIRVLKAGERPDEKAEKEPPGRRSGWIDLGRIKVSVDPAWEWRQMLHEAWRLMRDHFWTPDMSGVDWKRVWARYSSLVEKVATRLEFSDLVWEMQGELGTSHAYEFGGDYRRPPAYPLGYLGADLSWSAPAKGYRVDRIVRGDPWDEDRTSPLGAVGVNVKEGETILAVNGRPVGPGATPGALLVNQAGQRVELTVGDARGRKPRTVVVRTLRTETSARYREWVERNRASVHSKTRGQVGYVHVPDMSAWGYSEFHRYYLAEVGRPGLIVDVRYNGGGHVSQLILEKLARTRIGYDTQRWGEPQPYPADSVLGPLVAITNEQAGSDGDIFTHCFKLLKVGPVVGKRTWGGVIGISPKHVLVDNSLTTQPEYSFWFRDVGWGVENYGTDPDYDVEIAPQDYAAGRDPQMDKALELILSEMRRSPPRLPDFSKRPKLRLPKLPPRAR